MKYLKSVLICTALTVLCFSTDSLAWRGMGMMHEPYGGGMMGGYGMRNENRKPLDIDEARNMVSDYLENTENPNLKMGKIKDQGDYFTADILTKDGSLAEKIDIRKDTGYMMSHYGRKAGKSGTYGYGRRWNYCPYCGSGLHHQGGYGMGYGMPRHMMGPRRYGWDPDQGQPLKTPVDKDTAKKLIKDYLSSTKNPNLKMGDLKEKKNSFEVTIVTKKKEDPVDTVSIDKNTGWMRSIY